MCGRRSKKKKHETLRVRSNWVWYCWTEVQLAEACEEQSPGKNELAEEQMKQFHYPLKWFWKKKNPPQVVLSHPILKWGVSHLACGDLLSEGPFVTLDFTAHLVNLIECKWVDSESCPRPHSYLLLLWLCSVFSFLILIRHQREE